MTKLPLIPLALAAATLLGSAGAASVALRGPRDARSADACLQDAGPHNMTHVMFFVPLKSGVTLGANAFGSPLFGGNYWFVGGERPADAGALPPMSALLIGVAAWSDGTPAPMQAM